MGIDKYLIDHGFYGYYYEKTVPMPNFTWIESEIERCEDVVLLLGFWQEKGPGEWHRVGGHYVTCAGVNSDLSQLGISDPDCDNAEAGGPGRVPVPHPYPHNSSVHNDTQYVSHDIYNVTTSPSPGGTYGLQGYEVGKDITNFQFQNCPPEFESQQGIYEPALPVYTEIEYAVAVSPKPDFNEMIDSNWVWMEEGPMGGMVNIKVHVTDPKLDGIIWDMEVLFWTEIWGTEWPYNVTFSEPLQYCQDYYFDITYPVLPEIVVLHFSNEAGDNIGFAFSDYVEEWYWKPGNWTDYALSGMPDFDQRQDNWTNPQGNWTYCGPVAVANSLWWFDSREEPSPVPPPTINDNYGLVTNFSNPWDDHDAQNVIPLVNTLAWYMDTDGQRTNTSRNGTNVYDMQWGIDKYLIDTGFYGYYYEKTMPMPDFHWIESEIERCEDVVLLLGFWQENPVMGEWYRVGGHYVTCAGVNSNQMQLGISDPCLDNAEAGGPGRVPVPHPYPHNSSVHNDTQYVSHDIYTVTPSPSPGGIWGLENYDYGLNVSDFQFQNCPPEFEYQQGSYMPGLPVSTEIEYAVAVSPKPDLNEVIDSDYVYNETDGNVTIRVHVIDEGWDGIICDMEALFWTEAVGTYWAPRIVFPPLEYCEDYYFNITYDDEPEIVVLHFSNEAEENIGFAFSTPRPAIIDGTVYEANASPLDGATVNLTGPQAKSTTTNASGYYTFIVDQTGDYTVNVTGGGLTYAEKGVDVVKMGQTYTCNFNGVDAPYRTAPDILYCIKCSNLWLYGAYHGEFALDATRVSDVLYAWKNPS